MIGERRIVMTNGTEISFIHENGFDNVKSYIPFSRRMIYSMVSVLRRNRRIEVGDAFQRAVSILVMTQFIFLFTVCVWLGVKNWFSATHISSYGKVVILTMLVSYYIFSVWYYTRKKDLFRYYRIRLKLGTERQRSGLWVLCGFLAFGLCVSALILSVSSLD